MNIGDKVVLNNTGLEVIFGTTIGLSHMKTKVLTVVDIPESVYVDDVPDNKLSIIIVDDPEISQYLLFQSCFDIVNTR